MLGTQDNPLPWALHLMAGRIVNRLKSFLLGTIFGAKELYIGPGSVVRGVKHIRFGMNFSAHSGLWLEAVTLYRGQHFTPQIVLGDHVSCSHGVHISCIDRVEIKDNVLLGSHVYISDHNHGRYRGDLQSPPWEPPSKRALGGGGPVVIGRNAWIGDNVVIVGPVDIAEGTVVGANSVVRHSTTAGSMVAGIPARPLKQFSADSGKWESQ
jgi:acetyltransferase-like isoleucine patch superfamily enzyme